MEIQQEFWRRLKDQWPVEFCNDPARNYDIAGFRADAKKVTDADARDFLRAFNRENLTVHTHGRKAQKFLSPSAGI
jgi:predicted Zn-dependent peptidase